MFTVSEHTLDVASPAARARLANLIGGGTLNRASHSAYQHGLAALIRVGPLGDVPLASKLVAVRFLEPVERDGVTTTGLRWEATGPAASFFPVLDANITLTPDGPDHTRLTIAAAYRPPLGPLGAALDRTLLHHLATATLHNLATSIVTALTATAPAPRANTSAQPQTDP